MLNKNMHEALCMQIHAALISYDKVLAQLVVQ